MGSGIALLCTPHLDKVERSLIELYCSVSSVAIVDACVNLQNGEMTTETIEGEDGATVVYEEVDEETLDETGQIIPHDQLVEGIDYEVTSPLSYLCSRSHGAKLLLNVVHERFSFYEPSVAG